MEDHLQTKWSISEKPEVTHMRVFCSHVPSGIISLLKRMTLLDSVSISYPGVSNVLLFTISRNPASKSQPCYLREIRKQDGNEG